MKGLLRRLLHRVRSLQRRNTLRVRQAGARMHPRVLVVLTSGIGNSIAATPLIQALRMRWPACTLHLLTPWTEIFSGWSVPHAVTSTLEGPAGGWDHVFLPYDTELPEGIAADGALIHRVGSPLGGGPFTRSETDTDLELARAVGYLGPAPPLYCGWREPSPDPWSDRPRPHIVLAPCGKREARWDAKRWPGFATLAPLLAERTGGSVLVLGGPDEVGLEFPEPPGVEVGIDRWPLAESAGIIRSADLLIGNDCGLTHIADALQTPHLVLFGPTDEVKNGPLQSGRVLSPDVPCRPSQRWNGVETCPDCDCLGRITPEQVLTEALRMLG